MTREELNAVRGYVANIQAIKDAHNTEKIPINYGTICTITANGWKLIEELKALEQEPCEDAISRQAANDAIFSEPLYKTGMKERSAEEAVPAIFEKIKSLPPVTPPPKIGRWIVKDGKEQGYDIAGIKTWYIQIMCDKCGFIKTAIEGHTGQYKFCPNCGQPKNAGGGKNDKRRSKSIHI